MCQEIGTPLVLALGFGHRAQEPMPAGEPRQRFSCNGDHRIAQVQVVSNPWRNTPDMNQKPMGALRHNARLMPRSYFSSADDDEGGGVVLVQVVVV